MMKDAVVGCMLGTAVGDALGLPYEGLSRRRAQRMFPDLGRHHFILGKGMVSDDTEHACFVAQAVLASGGDKDIFQRCLARSLRWWLFSMPAGVGFATLRSIIKLWFGFSPRRSGVYSAGNGPAMRSPVLGVVYGASQEKLRQFVQASTEITHRDPKAYFGAIGCALAAFESSQASEILPSKFVEKVEIFFAGQNAGAFLTLVRQAAESAQKGESTVQFADSIGCAAGITGYIFDTVPCVIQTWLRFQVDFAGGIQEILAAGGDTDTTAAILGGIIGARVGKKGIPDEWLNGIIEWPRSIRWIERVAEQVAEKVTGKTVIECPGYLRIAIVPRNMLFLLVVLLHGFRRLAPPY